MFLPIKSVKQNYKPSDEMLALLEDFRSMVNDCIRIGLRENLTSLKSLTAKSYHFLSSNYNVPSCYRLTAISRAVGILKNYRKVARWTLHARIPHVERLSLTDCYGFKVFGRLLRLPFRRDEYLFIILNDHTLKILAHREHEIRSITLNTNTLSITYAKNNAVTISPKGLIGIDRNMGNVAIATSNAQVRTIDLSEVMRLKELYREIRSHLKRNDIRLRRKVFSKYGRREKNRVNQALQRATKEIIEIARNESLGIVLEDLKGIRKLGRRDNRQGRVQRFKINSWSAYEFARQLEYKAGWEGIPVFYVPAHGTSTRCSTCGCKKLVEIPNERRTLFCRECNTKMDRDENAARNILAKGLLRFGSDGSPGEAVRRNPTMTTVIRGANGGKRSAFGAS